MTFLFSYIYTEDKKEGLNKHEIKVLVKNHQHLKFMEHRVDLYSDFIRGPQLQKQQLGQEIERLNKNLDNLINIRQRGLKFRQKLI